MNSGTLAGVLSYYPLVPLAVTAASPSARYLTEAATQGYRSPELHSNLRWDAAYRYMVRSVVVVCIASPVPRLAAAAWWLDGWPNRGMLPSVPVVLTCEVSFQKCSVSGSGAERVVDPLLLESSTPYWKAVPMPSADALPSSCLTSLQMKACRLFRDLPAWIVSCRVLTELSLLRCQGAGGLTASLVGSFPSLRRLRVHFTPIENLDWLKDAPCLEDVDLFGCRLVQEYSPLATLQCLHTLKLSHCTVFSLRWLRKCARLDRLTVECCDHVDDFDPIGSLRKLRSLRITLNNQAADAKWMSTCAALEHIQLLWCEGVTDFGALGKLKALRRLDLHDTDIAQLPWLADCGRLEELSLSGCSAVRDLEGLRQVRCLRVLDMGFTRICNISWLSGCRTISVLSLENCTEIEDFGPLAALTELEDLCLSYTTISDLGVLRRLSNINNLSLKSCKRVTDFSSLGALTRLTTLNLCQCTVRDFSWVLACTQLKKLSVEGTISDDFSPIGNLIFLDQLSV